LSLKLLKNLLRLKYGGLAIFATVYELMDHEFTGKNELTCPHASYRVVIEQHVNGKLVGKLAVKTCIACDPGA
jgi:hypothetical protein